MQRLPLSRWAHHKTFAPWRDGIQIAGAGAPPEHYEASLSSSACFEALLVHAAPATVKVSFLRLTIRKALQLYSCLLDTHLSAYQSWCSLGSTRRLSSSSCFQALLVHASPATVEVGPPLPHKPFASHLCSGIMAQASPELAQPGEHDEASLSSSAC